FVCDNIPRGDFDGGRLKEGSGVCVRGEQGFDFAAQIVVVAASLRKKAFALIAVEIERAVIDFLDLPPPLRVHHTPPLSSRKSHACARLHSRCTVRVETFNASAVSSRLSPPKKRISTILLWRSSKVANSFSASSSATRSALFPCAIPSALASETCTASPPYFCACRRRASSTRTRRISCAARPMK